jgi:hypothetical protein
MTIRWAGASAGAVRAMAQAQHAGLLVALNRGGAVSLDAEQSFASSSNPITSLFRPKNLTFLLQTLQRAAALREGDANCESGR